MSDQQWYGSWAALFALNAGVCLWASVHTAVQQDLVLWACWLGLFAIADVCAILAASRAVRS